MAIQAQLVSDQSFGFSLGGPHDSIMETDAGFNHSFLIPQHQQLMQFGPFQNFYQHKNQSSFLKNFTVKDQQSVLFSRSLSSQIEKQRMEIDRFINCRVTSDVKWVRLIFFYIPPERETEAGFARAKKEPNLNNDEEYESNIQSLLKQKEEEILNATNRRMELEKHLERMEMENHTWKMAAKEKEAIAAALNSKIQRLRESACLSINAAEDAESCFRIEENEEQNTRKMICRCCGSRKACVIMLPCRHLCSCKDCEAFLDSCPVCKMVKKASLEAFIP
ncbi:putative BOI-related E3 ubiquitin-protein ligase 3 [Primulina tabacum]|uniref:putative BOI-related E3 ubiquitin-protein ligase 3 n=1 Tax=Primulina tabacum TaxID=48773 RepID=UPI003F5A7478